MSPFLPASVWRRRWDAVASPQQSRCLPSAQTSPGRIVHIPLAELVARLGEISVALIPVTVCGKGGGRSAEGADLLVALGRESALALEGGTLGWLTMRAKLSATARE